MALVDTELMTLMRTTVAAQKDAEEMAARLVDAGHAACVHVQPIASTYFWDGARRTEKEWLVEARTQGLAVGQAAWRLRKAMREGHPYDVPMIEAVQVRGESAYARWARGSQKQAADGSPKWRAPARKTAIAHPAR